MDLCFRSHGNFLVVKIIYEPKKSCSLGTEWPLYACYVDHNKLIVGLKVLRHKELSVHSRSILLTYYN